MNLADTRSRLRDNLAKVEARIGAACGRAERSRDAVTLIAVTKSVEPDVAALLPELGVRDLGESRPQELWRKAAALPTDVNWHLIGHLQRNKVARTLPLVKLIHSVDSVRLAEVIDGEAAKLGRQAHVLLEVNLSRESAKHGFPADQVPIVNPDLPFPYKHVFVDGLMTMAAATDDPERCRPVFAELRSLRDQFAVRTPGLTDLMNELSMGMTGDFEVAIEEGATMVRIGSALFEGID